MSAEMPARIWAGEVPLNFGGLEPAHLNIWDTSKDGRVWEPTAYVRADIADGLLEALREAEKDLVALGAVTVTARVRTAIARAEAGRC